jgi:plastocyanin
MRCLLAVMPLTAVIALAGCGGDDSSSSGGGSSSAEGAKAGSSVTMKDIAFSPKTLPVKVGQKVTWTNEEAVDHNVVATKGASFKSDAFGEGKTFSYTPKKAGTVDYECTLHPGMTAKLEVK